MNLVICGSTAPFTAPFTIFDHDTKAELPGEYETWREAKSEMVRLRGFQHNLGDAP